MLSSMRHLPDNCRVRLNYTVGRQNPPGGLPLKSVHLFLLALTLLPAACHRTANVTTPASEQGHYRVVHGWPILPDGYMLGQATGVGVSSRNQVFVFHRAGREWSEPFPIDPIPTATIAVFDGATGQQVAAWGAGLFIMPHGLTIDDEDNVWLTDVGRHQVYKFTSDGRLLFTLGEAGVPGDDRSHFNLPTDVAVLPVSTSAMATQIRASSNIRLKVISFSNGERKEALPDSSTFLMGSLQTKVDASTLRTAAIPGSKYSMPGANTLRNGKARPLGAHMPSSWARMQRRLSSTAAISLPRFRIAQEPFGFPLKAR
jgi:NHL repeat